MCKKFFLSANINIIIIIMFSHIIGITFMITNIINIANYLYY